MTHQPNLHTGRGGAGWTRTTDNAIMSRALYHLSYGTAPGRLAGGLLDPRLELALLLPVLRDCYSLSLVHILRRESIGVAWEKMVAEVGFEPTTFGL